MLNKLLKRCMPWMDKGRWYHVRIETEINSNGDIEFTNVSYDSLFSNHEVTDIDEEQVLNLYFKDQENSKCILDCKMIAHIHGDPTMPAGIAWIGYSANDYISLSYDNVKGNYVQISHIPFGSVDIWLFVRRF